MTDPQAATAVAALTLTDGQQAAYDEIMAWLELRDPRVKQPDGIELKYKKSKFQLPPGADEWFVDNPDDYYVLKGFAGSGKEQPVSTTVQTPTGPRRFGDLKVGDLVLGRDGSAVSVTGIFPQGIKPVYRVKFRDGAVTRCGLDHLWAIESSKKKHKGKLAIKSLREIIAQGVSFDCGPSRYKIPLCEPVEYSTRTPDIDAYVLGVLIGDGSLCNGTVRFSTPDMDYDIVQRVTERLPEFRLVGQNTGGCIQYCIRDNAPEGRTNRLMKEIRRLGLDVLSGSKFIPSEYLYAPLATRLDMLRGLMDTDGCSKGNRITFSTKAPRLAQDVKTLVQSLGGTAIVRSSDRTHHNKGIEFSVNVKMSINPFHSARKSTNWSSSSKNPPSRYIVSVEEDGVEEQMCIVVDAPDHLYLTDEFIVTHNTTVMSRLILDLSEQGYNMVVCAPTNKAVGVIQDKVREAANSRVIAADFRSVHSVCGLRMVETDDGDHVVSDSGISALDQFDVAIIDEGSMLDTSVLLKSIQRSRGRCLILIVGDPAQLPPIIEKAVAKVFRLPQGMMLTEIMRTALDNPLIAASMRIREKNHCDELLDEDSAAMFIGMGNEGRVQASDLLEWLPGSMVRGSNKLINMCIDYQRQGVDARIIAYRNTTVLANNKTIHFDLYPDSNCIFAVGERVIVQSACLAESMDTGKMVKLVTSEELTLEYVEEGPHPEYTNVNCYLLIMRDTTDHSVKVYTPKLMSAFKHHCDELFGRVNEINRQLKRGWDAKLADELKRARGGAWAFKNSFAEIRHTYSITAHKSQGSGFDCVLIDLPDLMTIQSAFEMNAALYVAITRARHTAHIAY